MAQSNETMASGACLFAGAVWGLFWIPLRAINDSGFNGFWTSVIWFAVPAIFLIPLVIIRWRSVCAGGLELQLTAFISGIALLLYTLAFIYTDVVRAMLLYYLTPVWSTLLARVILKEIITWQRIIAMVLAITGMLIIFDLGVSFPVPKNIGDWLGLASGVVWSFAAVRLRKFQSHSAVDMTIGFFFWSLVASLFVCVIMAPEEAPLTEEIILLLPWLIPVMIIAVIPGAFASLWGPKWLSPGLAGLLFMTEIIFGSISAAIFAGEPFGVREIIGIVLISAASMFEMCYGILLGLYGQAKRYEP